MTHTLKYVCSGCGREQEAQRNSIRGVPRCGTCDQNMIPEGRLHDDEPSDNEHATGLIPPKAPTETKATSSLLDAMRNCNSHRRG